MSSTAGKLTPIKTAIGEAALRCGWTCQQVESNVYNYRKRGASLTVAYTFGGHMNIQTVLFERGAERWRMTHKTPRKRATVLEILEDVK